MATRGSGLETLLDLDGYVIDQGHGYWVKIEARKLREPSKERPHGISYCLSLHDNYGQRIMGFDNAHAVVHRQKGKYSGRRFAYDHKHRHISDKGVPYEFVDAYQLLSDFFKEVDKVVKQHKRDR